MKGNEFKYGLVAKILHWLIFLMMVGLVASGTIMTTLVYDDPQRLGMVLTHRTVGSVLFILMILRLVWRFIDVRPKPEASLQNWEKILSVWVQGSFYVLLLIIPILGYLFSGANGIDVKLHGIELPSLMQFSRDGATTIIFLHKYITYFVLFLLFLHVAGAFKHYFIDKNNIFKRMW